MFDLNTNKRWAAVSAWAIATTASIAWVTISFSHPLMWFLLGASVVLCTMFQFTWWSWSRIKTEIRDDFRARDQVIGMMTRRRRR